MKPMGKGKKDKATNPRSNKRPALHADAEDGDTDDERSENETKAAGNRPIKRVRHRRA